MAKIYGLFGSMTGKLADVVMSVRNGEQIARKYQPVVSNPSTQAQVAQRAKLKLLSQLSAVMAPVIAIKRQGNVSGRNIFTKKNIINATFADDIASIPLSSIQLTNSVYGIPSILASHGEGVINLSLIEASIAVDRMVYCLFSKSAAGELRFMGSVVSSSVNVFDATFTTSYTGAVLVLAYGIKDNDEAAHVKFGELNAPTAQDIAKILVTSTLTDADVTVSLTQGYELAAVASRDGDDEDNKKSSKKK